MHIAYLLNQYPYASATFIRRELLALEGLGFTISRFSIRPTEHALRDESDLDEAAKTSYVMRVPKWALIGNALRTLVSRPAAVARALQLVWKCGRVSAERGVLVHCAYLIQACTLLRWTRQRGVEHIHAHFATNPVSVAMLLRVLGGPTYSFTVHGPTEFDLAFTLALNEKIARAKFVVAISQFARSQIYRWCKHEDWPKIHIVRCGVSDAFLHAPKTPPASEPRFLCIGRLSEQKGQLLLVEAVHRLVEKGVELTVDIVGDGEMREAIEELIRRYSLQNRVRLLGWQTEDEVRRHLINCRALVLPSFAEGLPVVLMEALAVGRPVITTPVAGIPELVQPNANGWLVVPGSVESLESALSEAIAAPCEQLSAMGAAGAEVVAREHNVLNEAHKLAELHMAYAA
jgi:colanic acid/amylovoran biosynthesis glycosyltransferase